jgi:hypothetical protein
VAVKTKRTRRATKRLTEREALEAAASANGIPLWVLVGVKLAETGDTANAPNPFELEPATASSLGVKNVGNFAEAANGAAKLLAQYHHTYGSWNSAFEAYNGGPGAVGKGYAYGESHILSKLHEFGLDKMAASAGPHAQTVGLGEDLFGGKAGGIFENFVNPFHFQPFNGGKAEGLENPITGAHSLNPLEPVMQAGAAVTDLVSMLTDIHFWIRVGEAIAALILIYMGLHSLTGQGPSPSSVAQTATAAAAVK